MENCTPLFCGYSPFFIAFGIMIVALLIVFAITQYFGFKFVRDLHKKNQNSHEVHKLLFAGGVLASLGSIFVLAMLMFYLDTSKDGDRSEMIFETVKTVIPPIITLILGYYFGTSVNRDSIEVDGFKSSSPDQESKEDRGPRKDR